MQSIKLKHCLHYYILRRYLLFTKKPAFHYSAPYSTSPLYLHMPGRLCQSSFALRCHISASKQPLFKVTVIKLPVSNHPFRRKVEIPSPAPARSKTQKREGLTVEPDVVFATILGWPTPLPGAWVQEKKFTTYFGNMPSGNTHIEMASTSQTTRNLFKVPRAACKSTGEKPHSPSHGHQIFRKMQDTWSTWEHQTHFLSRSTLWAGFDATKSNPSLADFVVTRLNPPLHDLSDQLMVINKPGHYICS